MSAVFESRTLPPGERLVMLALADHAGEDGTCYPSIRRLCERTGMSERTVQGHIKKLTQAGYLTVAANAGRGLANLYHVNPTPAESAGGKICTPAKSAPPPPQNLRLTPAESAPKPSVTTIEPSTEAAEGAREVDHDLVGRLTHALGFDHHGQVPRYWAAPDTILIVAKWQTDLGLTPDEILHIAVANMRQRGSPARGPKILTEHMQDYAAAKNTKLTPTPIEGGTSRARRQTPYTDRRQQAADDAFAKRIAAVARARPLSD